MNFVQIVRVHIFLLDQSHYWFILFDPSLFDELLQKIHVFLSLNFGIGKTAH